MDTTITKVAETADYDTDYYAWCLDQAARLRARARPGTTDGLDYGNLAEEMESLGRSDRRAIKSHMRVLLAHLLKWRLQPERRGSSWEDTIFNARHAIAELIDESPSLDRHARDAIAKTYPLAVRDAASETGLAGRDFPVSCPFSDAEVLDRDFLPAN